MYIYIYAYIYIYILLIAVQTSATQPLASAEKRAHGAPPKRAARAPTGRIQQWIPKVESDFCPRGSPSEWWIRKFGCVLGSSRFWSWSGFWTSNQFDAAPPVDHWVSGYLLVPGPRYVDALGAGLLPDGGHTHVRRPMWGTISANMRMSRSPEPANGGALCATLGCSMPVSVTSTPIETL